MNFIKNSFDRDLNVAETALLLLENGLDFQNRNISRCLFQICKVFSVDESLKFQERSVSITILFIKYLIKIAK